jgi:hypothetical protein
VKWAGPLDYDFIIGPAILGWIDTIIGDIRISLPLFHMLRTPDQNPWKHKSAIRGDLFNIGDAFGLGAGRLLRSCTR